MPGEAGGAAGEARELPDTRRARRCAKTIENISRIRMVVARASGTLMASSLKQNKFSIWGHTIFKGSSQENNAPKSPNRDHHSKGGSRGAILKSKSILLQTRRRERPRSSRDHHSNPTDALYHFSASIEPRVAGVTKEIVDSILWDYSLGLPQTFFRCQILTPGLKIQICSPADTAHKMSEIARAPFSTP